LDAKIEFRVSDNKMKVVANYVPARGTGKDVSVDEALAQLESMGVTTGILRDRIALLCGSDRPMRNVVVAEGIPPQKGEKARIISYFEINKRRRAVEREDGSVDFHDLGEIASAKAGQELYRKVPPTTGEPGKDVFGNEIPGLPGKDLRIVLGRGTELDKDDPNLVRASYDGEIIVNKGIVQISKVHKVDGDVDFSTGNVKFSGSVKIKGTVKSGFKVEAEGDIEIGGNVENAEIIGINDVIIHGGFTGNGDGRVSAGRDVILKFVENQKIEAERDIIISGPSYHAHLKAGRSILSQGAQSVIVGGESEAKISIEARKLGSEAGAKTVLRVGVDPKLFDMLKQVEDEISMTKESQEKIEKSVVFLYRQKIDNNGVLPPDKQKLLDELEKTKDNLPLKLKMLEEKKERLLSEQEELGNAYISADVGVYPKVRIYFGQQWMSVDDTLGPSTFKLVKGEIARISK